MRRQNITEFFGGYLWVSVGLGTGRKVCLKSVLVETPGKDPAAEICTRHPSLTPCLALEGPTPQTTPRVHLVIQSQKDNNTNWSTS